MGRHFFDGFLTKMTKAYCALWTATFPQSLSTALSTVFVNSLRAEAERGSLCRIRPPKTGAGPFEAERIVDAADDHCEPIARRRGRIFGARRGLGSGDRRWHADRQRDRRRYAHGARESARG